MQCGGGTVVDDLADWWQHDIGITRKTGSSGYEDTFAAKVSAKGFYDGGNKQVRSATGDQVLSTATVFLPITEAIIPAGSLITAPPEMGAREGKVIQCIRREVGAMPLPVHWEVMVE